MEPIFQVHGGYRRAGGSRYMFSLKLGGMSVFVGRAAGNTRHGEAGRGCQQPGLAKLNYSVLVAKGQSIFYVQSQDCSGVSVFG
jgi:hypothetical protein